MGDWRDELGEAISGPQELEQEAREKRDAARPHIEDFIQGTVRPAFEQLAEELQKKGADVNATFNWFGHTLPELSVDDGPSISVSHKYHRFFRYSLPLAYNEETGEVLVRVTTEHHHEGGKVLRGLWQDIQRKSQPVVGAEVPTQREIIDDFVSRYKSHAGGI